MTHKLWQIDAFAARPLEGNPAAVVPLQNWLDDATMQRIAGENNLAETAFFTKREAGSYNLRWFTPDREVDLCGHATLASAYVIFQFLVPQLGEVKFQTRSGELTVIRGPDNRNIMSLPAAPSEPFSPPHGFTNTLGEALGAAAPEELHFSHKGGAGAGALIGVWPSPDEIKALRPNGDLAALLQSVKAGSLLATARGDAKPYDFVSRFFAPYYGVPEDPVTGSAHCALAPFWAKRLGRAKLNARQVSPRGGDLYVKDAGDRVEIAGDCALYLTGEITI